MGSAILIIFSFTWQGYPNPRYDSTAIKTCEHVTLIESKSDEMIYNNYFKEEDFYCINLLKSK